MSIGEHRNILNIRICMRKKPIVSVTYIRKMTYRFCNIYQENERISIKNSLPHIKCVTSLLCCPWTDLRPFYGLYCKRFSLSLYAVRRSHGKDSLYPVFENSNCSPSKQFVVEISGQLLRTFAPTIYLKFIWYTYYINKG